MMRVFITIEWRMISMVKTVKGDNFEDIKACGVAVADFSATWCGPCKMMAPVFQRGHVITKVLPFQSFQVFVLAVFHTVADELNGEVDFFSVDVDENPGLAAANKVFSVPTLILYKNGVEASRSVGAISKYDLLDFIEKIK